MAANPATRITETSRPLRTEEPVQIQREIWFHLQRQARDAKKTRETAARGQAAERERLHEVVTDLARAHHQLTRFLERNTAALEDAGLTSQAELLVTIRDRYGQVFTRAGAELLYLDEGQPLRLDLLDKVQIVVSVPSEDADGPRVLETVNPGVLVGAEVVSKAEVRLAVPGRSGTGGQDGQASGPGGGQAGSPSGGQAGEGA